MARQRRPHAKPLELFRPGSRRFATIRSLDLIRPSSPPLEAPSPGSAIRIYPTRLAPVRYHLIARPGSHQFATACSDGAPAPSPGTAIRIYPTWLAQVRYHPITRPGSHQFATACSAVSRLGDSRLPDPARAGSLKTSPLCHLFRIEQRSISVTKRGKFWCPTKQIQRFAIGNAAIRHAASPAL